jgi:hypothetical protein
MLPRTKTPESGHLVAELGPTTSTGAPLERRRSLSPRRVSAPHGIGFDTTALFGTPCHTGAPSMACNPPTPRRGRRALLRSDPRATRRRRSSRHSPDPAQRPATLTTPSAAEAACGLEAMPPVPVRTARVRHDLTRIFSSHTSHSVARLAPPDAPLRRRRGCVVARPFSERDCGDPPHERSATPPRCSQGTKRLRRRRGCVQSARPFSERDCGDPPHERSTTPPQCS